MQRGGVRVASVYSSKIVTDILKAIDAKLEKFKTYVLNTVASRTIPGSQIEAESISGSKYANESISARAINAAVIFADIGVIGEITTNLVKSDLGERLDIKSNEAIGLLAESVDIVSDELEFLGIRRDGSEISLDPEKIVSSVRSSTEYINDLNSIMIIDSNDPPEDAPNEGKIWADGGVSPTVFRRWLGADVSTDREYTLSLTGSLITIDNTKGDVQNISVSAPEASDDITVTVGSDSYTIPFGESIDVPPVIGLNILIPSEGTIEVIYSGSGWETVNDTSALQEGLDELGDETTDILNSLSSVSTAITQTASDVSVIKTETLVDLNGRVKTIESGVKVDGSIVDLGSSESIYGARVSHVGFRVSQTDQIEPIFAAERGRVLAQAMQMGVIVARKTSTGGWAWDV